MPLEEFIQTVYILLVPRPTGFFFINWQRFGPQESSRNSYEDWVRKQEIVPSKVIRIPESKKVLLVVSGIPGLEIRNPAKVWSPESKFHRERIQNPVPEFRNPRRGGIQNPRLYWISLYSAKPEGYSWKFLVGVCCPVVQFPTLLNVLIHTHVQTWPLRNIVTIT